MIVKGLMNRCSQWKNSNISSVARRTFSRSLRSIDDKRDEEEVREDLSIAHKLCAFHGFDELTWNHLSSKVNDGEDYLITPGNRHFSMIEPDHLVWARSKDLKNVTANVIHGAIYDSRPDVKAIVHCHSTACVFVSNLPGKDPLRLYTQDGGGFYGKVAYHDFEGVANEHDEQARIQQDFGESAHTLVMRNHGAVTTGATIGQAWVRMFYFDRVCEAQMNIYKAGMASSAPALDEAILRKMSKTYEDPAFAHGVEWPAMVEFCREKLS